MGFVNAVQRNLDRLNSGHPFGSNVHFACSYHLHLNKSVVEYLQELLRRLNFDYDYDLL